MTDSVQLFRSLGDETRLRILNLLAQGELCVCDIMGILRISQSKASRHLAHLRHAGLVADRREGVWMHYSLAPAGGAMHRRVVNWLARAQDEIPHAAADSTILADLRRRGESCATDPTRQRKPVAAKRPINGEYQWQRT